MTGRRKFVGQLGALAAAMTVVCNVALGNWARGWAERAKRDPELVVAEARANLIPGAILVPSGIYGLIRAQNAGCAYMPGS